MSRRRAKRRARYPSGQPGWDGSDYRGLVFVALDFICEGPPDNPHPSVLVERVLRHTMPGTHDPARGPFEFEGRGRPWDALPKLLEDTQGPFIMLRCVRPGCDRAVPVSVSWITERLDAMDTPNAQQIVPVPI